MTVWIVLSSDDNGDWVAGVYAEEELANSHIEKHGGYSRAYVVLNEVPPSLPEMI
jgi:hypothetical protein